MIEDQAHSVSCLCRSVSFRLFGDCTWTSYCHCASCRRATGAALTVFVGFRDDQIQLVGREPRVFESSPGITRGFCDTCGTSLWYRDGKLQSETYFLLGAFEHPESFKPKHHAFLADKLPWLAIHDEAARHQGFSVPRLLQTAGCDANEV